MNRYLPVDPVIYREVQKFDQLWLWLMLLIPASFVWYGAIEQLIYGRPFGNNPLTDTWVIVIWAVFGVLMPLFFLSVRLIIVVKNSGLYVRFFPIHISFRHYPYEILDSYETITYRPILDYGGWGIRYGLKGKIYNIKGKNGLMLKFRDGADLMLGSQEADILLMSIDQGRNRKKNDQEHVRKS